MIMPYLSAPVSSGQQWFITGWTGDWRKTHWHSAWLMLLLSTKKATTLSKKHSPFCRFRLAQSGVGDKMVKSRNPNRAQIPLHDYCDRSGRLHWPTEVPPLSLVKGEIIFKILPDSEKCFVNTYCGSCKNYNFAMLVPNRIESTGLSNVNVTFNCSS